MTCSRKFWKLPGNMQKRIKNLLILENVLVLGILVVAFILRIYRVDQILAFHYDQGRDALVIWDLIHSPHKLFLIGPTTGLAGVFRGPFYYYLIAPLYLLGRGNPVWPAVFLAFTSTLALYLLYKLAKEIGGVKAGIIALILGSFSLEIIFASRWLSNPTPMLILSMLMILSMFRIYDGKKNYWILLAAVLGLSFFNFGSSGELFFFPVIAVFATWMIFRQGFGKVKSTLNWKTVLVSAGVFLLTFAPLFVFNLRHGEILSNNIVGLIGSENNFAIPTWRFVQSRGSLLVSYFSALIFHSPYEKETIIATLVFVGSVYFLASVLKNDKSKIIFGFLASGFLGLIFFQGNNGNLYAYYLTGYYLLFLLLMAIVLAKAFEHSWISKVLIVYFVYFFLAQNWLWVKPYITMSPGKQDVIVLGNQERAIDWVYKNAGNRDFNVDVYVPPVIPYSYDYLFKWLGTEKYQKLPATSQISLLYTLYEADPEHKERLSAWLDRQKGIGIVVKQESFGGITVQERTRINKK